MRKIRILCIGKKQEPYLKAGIEAYRKKLQRYCQFDIKLLKEADYGNGSIQRWQTREQKEIENNLKQQAFTIVCDETGKHLASVQFAAQLQKIAGRGYSNIDFVIGGPYGLPPEIKKQANLLISLSSMTLTHQIARLFLTEQIYRAFTIINGEKYHH